jgi:hypothetical protein
MKTEKGSNTPSVRNIDRVLFKEWSVECAGREGILKMPAINRMAMALLWRIAARIHRTFIGVRSSVALTSMTAIITRQGSSHAINIIRALE